MNPAPTLIIPVESQVRELDAKLLLSCCAAERGYPVVIGSRAYVHFAIAGLPRGIYAAKSMRGISELMFRIIRDLGHDIVAWEEEALVHPPPEVFFSLRLASGTVGRVSHVFAWGEDNAELLRQYPSLPPGLRMHVTGNPRGDMLRPELRPFFAAEVSAIRAEFGDFLLLNTNFTDVNPYLPTIGLFVPSKDPSQPARLGQAGKGMPRDFAEGLRAHKQSILEDFLAMIPALEQAFPGVNLVLRPHPSEDHGIYHRLAARCSRVRVTHRGNVVPWLLACKALVHNGCTTAVESYAMGVPSVAYLKTFDPTYDRDFQGLPNRLSEQCFSLDELIGTVQAIIAGPGPAAATPERDALLNHYIAARTGPLASERILDLLDAHYRQQPLPDPGPAYRRLKASVMARVKGGLTRLNMHRPGPNRRAYHDHRFPRLSAADVTRRIERLGDALGRFRTVRVRQRAEHLFDVFAAGS
jgi:surface carbohydrate biosynthesis protein